jgi:WD40 repeat protein
MGALMLAPPAHAVLVYSRPAPSGERDAPIVAARNDGSDARVIANGFAPRVSPSGGRIAYLKTTEGSVDLHVVGNRGARRQRLARRTFDLGPFSPIAWSPDSRYVVIPDPYPDARLVDVRQGTTRRIRAGDQDDFVGASFDPEGGRFVIARAFPREPDPQLTVVAVRGRERRGLGVGDLPVWGRPGLAFSRTGKVLLRKRIGERAKTLLRRSAYSLDWSDDGDRLLTYVPRTGETVVIDLSPRRVTTIPERLFPSQLSDDGKHILGEAGGNVVVRRPSGTVDVLAEDATRPSWTK